MVRKIIQIDKEKCNGCGICADACHEAAIGMVDGKATLLRDDYCDGLGDCLPTCPTGAITFIEREAAAYDEEAVKANLEKIKQAKMVEKVESRLGNWPVQIKLAPPTAPYFNGADLLVAADCTAYAYGNFHQDFIQGKVTVVGCPKLDGIDYSEKLTEILSENDVKSVTITRMEVPCCGGLEFAVKNAVSNCGKEIPLKVVTIGIRGDIL